MKTGVCVVFNGTHRSKRQSRFMEKKIERTEKDRTSISYSSEEKTIIATIIIAIVIISALLVNLMLTPVPPEKFSTIYYLDSEKKTENLPKAVVLGENSTFLLWVGVENHKDTTIDYQVLVKYENGKTTEDPSPTEATESFENTLADGETWEFPLTINIDTLGTNRVIIELWYLNATSMNTEYTGNWVNISVEAT